MVRTSLLALTLLMPVAMHSPVRAAPPRKGYVLPDPTQLRWEIIAYERGGKGGWFVVERITGSEARASARATSVQLSYPKYVVAYREAR
jgi:hypothetical protein